MEAIQVAQMAVSTKTQISKAYLINQANDIMLKAKANGAWSAAKSANELLAKLTGHIVERRDMRVIRSYEDLTDEELLALAQSMENAAQGPQRH
jgi:hypothetical protein